MRKINSAVIHDRRRAGVLAVTLMICSYAVALRASDAYIVRFNALGIKLNDCQFLTWRDDVVMYNTTPAPATIRLLGMSNGTLAPGVPTTFEIAGGQMASFKYSRSDVITRWFPVGYPPLYVVHLDVPTGFVVESRDEMYFETPCVGVGGGRSVRKVSMPIFRELIPPGVPQVTLGTDLGERTTRINVGVYNAGSATATASIEVRRGCDGSVVGSRVVAIPPNTIVQVPGFTTGTLEGCNDQPPQTVSFQRYVTVTVDQPSFSYVANVTESAPSTSPVNIIPPVGLGVPHNTRF